MHTQLRHTLAHHHAADLLRAAERERALRAARGAAPVRSRRVRIRFAPRRREILVGSCTTAG